MLAALTVCVKKIKRPSGTRFHFPPFPALKAPGYCQSPLRGVNSFFPIASSDLIFHCIARFNRRCMIRGRA
jgi:hypothetical protein